MSFASAISRITGLLGILVLAYAFGALDYLQDSYNLAKVMPNMLFELIAGGILTSIFIPVLVERILEDKERSWRLASNIVNITTIFMISIATLGTIFSYELVRAQTFLVSTDSVDITNVVFFFRFFIWQIVFYGMVAIFNGVLQAHRRFAAPAYAPIFNNLVVIAVIIFFYIPLKDTNPGLALTGLAAGTTLGIVVMALVQLPALLRIGWKYHAVIDLRDPAIRKLGVLALPIFAYVLSNQIGLSVANALAWKFEGGITAFTYAWRFFQLPFGLLAVSISTVIFPRLSEHSVMDDMSAFKRTLGRAVTATSFVLIPVSVYFFLLSRQTIGLFELFFGAKGTEQIASVMALFMIGLLPFSLFMLLNRVFYALHDSATPMKVNAVGVPLNILLNFLLVRFFNVAGLSLGHSLTYLFTMSLMFFALKRRIGPLNGRALFQSALKFTLISIPVGVIIVMLAAGLGSISWPSDELGHLVVLVMSALVGGSVYIALSAAIGSEEVEILRSMVRGLTGRRGPELALEIETEEITKAKDL